MLGKVKWFDVKKGYGFLEAHDESYFVHYSEIKGAGFKTLNEGDNVDFKVMTSPKGLQASEVFVIK